MDFLNKISLFIGIWVAIYGIDSWRREHKGKRQIELAEDTLALFYEAKDIIAYIRQPFSYGNETEGIERAENESDAHFDARKNASIVFKRYNENIEVFNKIHSMRYRFMAQFGREKAKPFEELHSLIKEITIAARMLARLWPKKHFRSDEDREKHLERVQKFEEVFWDGLTEEDPINPKLEEIIVNIEKTCKSVIEGKGTLYSFLNWEIKKKS